MSGMGPRGELSGRRFKRESVSNSLRIALGIGQHSRVVGGCALGRHIEPSSEAKVATGGLLNLLSGVIVVETVD